VDGAGAVCLLQATLESGNQGGPASWYLSCQQASRHILTPPVGYVSEQTGYHHGEASLHGTITNMAQTFVGSDNLPLLFPSGQFGTRLDGGKDAASPRYVGTLSSSPDT
jgi:hypothetical protein